MEKDKNEAWLLMNGFKRDFVSDWFVSKEGFIITSEATRHMNLRELKESYKRFLIRFEEIKLSNNEKQ